jgi:hypothetical protein
MVSSLTHGQAPGGPSGSSPAQRRPDRTGSPPPPAPTPPPAHRRRGQLAMQIAAFRPRRRTPRPVTSPTAGAALTGTVTVTVTATDPDSGLQAASWSTGRRWPPQQHQPRLLQPQHRCRQRRAQHQRQRPHGVRATGSPAVGQLSNGSGQSAVSGLDSPSPPCPSWRCTSQMPDARIPPEGQRGSRRPHLGHPHQLLRQRSSAGQHLLPATSRWPTAGSSWAAA